MMRIAVTSSVSPFFPALQSPGGVEVVAVDNMGTQGCGRKRAQLKDRFSAEDEALSSIAREVSLCFVI